MCVPDGGHALFSQSMGLVASSECTVPLSDSAGMATGRVAKCTSLATAHSG